MNAIESWALSMLFSMASSYLPALITKFIPKEALAVFSFVSDDTKVLITKGLKYFKTYSDTTPNDTTWGKVDNILAAFGETFAKTVGLWLEMAPAVATYSAGDGAQVGVSPTPTEGPGA